MLSEASEEQDARGLVGVDSPFGLPFWVRSRPGLGGCGSVPGSIHTTRVGPNTRVEYMLIMGVGAGR